MEYTLTHRDQFPTLMDALGCRTAAEVGVAAGDFSSVLLGAKIDHLWMIDNWCNPADIEAGHRDRAYAVAGMSGGRAVVLEKPSAEAAAMLPDLSVDFVYIDTQHDYRHTMADLEAWWPKTRRVLAGHDYVFWNTVAACVVGVVPAVERFFAGRQGSLWVTGSRFPCVGSRLLSAYEAAALTSPGPWARDWPSFYFVKE